MSQSGNGFQVIYRIYNPFSDQQNFSKLKYVFFSHDDELHFKSVYWKAISLQ